MKFEEFCKKYELNPENPSSKTQFCEYEKQTDLNLSGHGGKRINAGRKAKFGKETKPIRVPIELIKEIEWFIDSLTQEREKVFFENERFQITVEIKKPA